MSKQKTPLQQLKRKIVPHSCWQDNDGMVWIDKQAVIDIINEMLDSERQAIEQAYMSGLMDGVGAPMTYKSESDYFTETYEI